ncbi:MAG: hypothetical protein ACFFD4_27905 [Candidatus Odinarchaeota archaeon]
MIQQVIDQELEFFVNISSMAVLIPSGIIFFFLAYKILAREDKEYFEMSFGMGLIAAGCASFLGALFRIPYVLGVNEEALPVSWDLGSYFYYILMVTALAFVLSCGLAVMRRKQGFYSGLLGILGVIPISLAYMFGQVSSVPGNADMTMTTIGALLVFGTLGVLIFVTAGTYLIIYMQTRNPGSRMMFIGMVIILLSAAIAALSDVIAGNLGRYFDSVGYLFVLAGLLAIYYGFKSKPAGD